MEEAKEIIAKYLCNKEGSNGFGIYELMQKLLLFELCYENINKRLLDNNVQGTILESDLLKNMFLIGHSYTQINILGKLFDNDNRSISFINLWKETKDLLIQDEKYEKLKSLIENLKSNKYLKSIYNARNKIVCHNDSDSNRKLMIDIRNAVIVAFDIYNYFNSFLTKNFDFLNLREEDFLKDEIEKLSLPFFKDESQKIEFEENYKKILNEFNLKYMTFTDVYKLMNTTVKVDINVL